MELSCFRVFIESKGSLDTRGCFWPKDTAEIRLPLSKKLVSILSAGDVELKGTEVAAVCCFWDKLKLRLFVVVAVVAFVVVGLSLIIEEKTRSVHQFSMSNATKLDRWGYCELSSITWRCGPSSVPISLFTFSHSYKERKIYILCIKYISFGFDFECLTRSDICDAIEIDGFLDRLDKLYTSRFFSARRRIMVCFWRAWFLIAGRARLQVHSILISEIEFKKKKF